MTPVEIAIVLLVAVVSFMCGRAGRAKQQPSTSELPEFRHSQPTEVVDVRYFVVEPNWENLRVAVKRGSTQLYYFLHAEGHEVAVLKNGTQYHLKRGDHLSTMDGMIIVTDQRPDPCQC